VLFTISIWKSVRGVKKTLKNVKAKSVKRNFPYLVKTAVRSPSGRSSNAPAAFIDPCRPVVAERPPSGAGWGHEIKHDGYRLQIHVRDGHVRLYTMNGADWSKRYPLIFQDAARVKDSAIFDAEVVWLGSDGVADFAALQSGANDAGAAALAFDLLMLNGDDLRRKPFVQRKTLLRSALRDTGDGIQTVEYTEGDGATLFEAVCRNGLEGIVSKELDSPYRSGRSKSWITVKNPKAPAATRAIDSKVLCSEECG
jgi:bifunctional non-homologous end joining protein LigD